MSETLIFSENNKLPPTKKKIFIGRWLLKNKKKKIQNYKVFNNNLSIKNKVKEYKYVKRIYSKVLRNLTPILNNIHKKNYKESDWEILLFYSLVYYISFAYNKWETIKKLKNKYNLKPVEVFSFQKNYFLKDDSQSFYTQMKSDEYDDWLTSKIIKAQNLKFYEKTVNKKRKKSKSFSNLKRLKLYKILFPNNYSKFFLINLTLPKFLKVKLNLILNKKIRIYNRINFQTDDNISIKRKLFRAVKTNNKFEKFIYDTLYEILPRNFLENFEFIETNIDYLNWPKKPKVIFTSYEHYFNDVFKIYVIIKRQEGAKLNILQHGHQGLNNLCFNYYEKKICNNYFNWGNSKDYKEKNLFCTTTIGKNLKKKIKKDILISYTEFPLKPWKFMPLPRVIDETEIYKDDLIELLSCLRKKPERKITLKYFAVDKNKYTTDEIKRKFKDLSFIRTDLKKRGFEFSNKYRLNIETTNSTGFIELLSLNIPVILVTNKDFFDVKKEYKKFFDDLIKCNIIFFDPKKAADFINSNLDDIDNWWFGNLTQKKIKNFCYHICRYEDNLNNGLSSLINLLK